MITGCGFPLAVAIAHRDTKQILATSGITEAADHLGGALGGFITGALLIPILGIEKSCYLLAVFAVLSTLPLMMVNRTTTFTLLSQRGYQAFPYSRLSWLLGGCPRTRKFEVQINIQCYFI